MYPRNDYGKCFAVLEIYLGKSVSKRIRLKDPNVLGDHSTARMLVSAFIYCAILAFVFSSVSAHSNRREKCSGPLKGDIVPEKPVNKTVDVALNLGEGWQPFYFGQAGTWAMASTTSGAFYLDTWLPVVLRMSDAFVSGDRFSLYINGTMIGNTSLPVPNSPFYTPDPNEAFVNANYSTGAWILPRGLHRITIKTLLNANPTGAGSSAFIRADVNPRVKCGNCRPTCRKAGPCVCFPRQSIFNPPGCCANSSPMAPPFGPMCKESTGKYMMLKTPMTHNEGVEACRQMNMRLAAINIENFTGVNQFAFLCNNQQVANTWIQSWNGDSYGETCLVMQSGSFGGNGAITAGDCTSLQFVMCEA